MAALLPIKFSLPPLPSGFVERPTLFAKLDDTLSHRLALVSAQAGSGKTTLVSAWAHSLRKKGVITGWLSLDEGDNIPERFLEYLVGCLEEGGAPFPPEMLIFEKSAAPSPEEYLAEFIRALLGVRQEMVVILDDYHLIHDLTIHTALGYLLEHLPPLLHICLLTRSDPPFELARLRVAGYLLEVRMENLRFSSQEAASFLKKSAGVQLSQADLSALNERTEGWIAGLQMAAISLRGRQDVSAFVSGFKGSHRFVFDYFFEQVLKQQTPELRQFLLQTSVLEQLCAPLCEAVAETGGRARALLDTLERANLFLAPLDDERAWYRYHHLFAELLRMLLEQEPPGQVTELHCRAAKWYEAQGMIPESFQHALSANDAGMAARLVSENVLALVEHAELAPILLRMEATRGARALQPGVDSSSPWLEVAHAWALAYTGQMERARVALSNAERSLAEGSLAELNLDGRSLAERSPQGIPAGVRDEIAGHIAAVRAYTAWVQGNQQESLEMAELATRLLPDEAVAVRALTLTSLGNALSQYRADPRAVGVLEQATALAQGAGQTHVYMLASSALAYAHIVLGELRTAQAVCLEAIAAAEAYQRRHGHPLPAAACVYIMLASIHNQRGEIQAALQLAQKSLALSELWGQADSILLCLINLADMLSLSGDYEAARGALGRGRRLAQNISPWFVLNVDLIEVNMWLDAGDVQKASQVARAAAMPLPTWVQARLLLNQNRPDEVLSLLDSAQSEEPASLALNNLRMRILEAMALYLKKDETQALAAIKRALEMAEPENIVISFLRGGQMMEQLLKNALVRSITPQFTSRLLAAFQQGKQPQVSLIDELYIEELSERELEVLHRLNSHLSVPEIADELFVTANTVRTHIKNIYGKLGVHRRSVAVGRAHDLGLLT